MSVIHKIGQWLANQSTRTGAVVVFLLLASVYTISGDYDGGKRHNIDGLASALPAQRLVVHGDLDLSEYVGVRWFVESEGRIVTNRPPGGTLVALPFYLALSPWLPKTGIAVWPMAVIGITITSLAMAVLYVALRKVVAPAIAFGVAVAYGITTPTWAFSGTTLWPHGPNQLAIAGGLYVIFSRQRQWLLAPIGALALLTRPVMAVPFVVIGCYLLWAKRFSSAAWLAGGGIFGLVGLWVWNRALFNAGTSSYQDAFVTNVVGLGVDDYAARITGALFDPLRGVIFVTPLLVVACFVAIASWKSVKTEVKVFAFAGFLYLAAHMAFNRFSPNLRTNFRYPIETITLLAPLVAIGVQSMIATVRGRILLQVLAAWGFTFQLLHVLEVERFLPSSPDWLPWSHNP